MKHVTTRPFADPDTAARKLIVALAVIWNVVGTR
jgi:hypothetical protein